MIARWDFTYMEWSSLLGLYRRENVQLTDDVNRRLCELGATENSVGRLTDVARTLVERELLMERRNRLQR